jgi:hypothetical protein
LQIGRLGASLLWAVLGKLHKEPKFRDTFSTGKVMLKVKVKKIGWATFWAIFSPTHPVTLKLKLKADKTERKAKRPFSGDLGPILQKVTNIGLHNIVHI